MKSDLMAIALPYMSQFYLLSPQYVLRCVCNAIPYSHISFCSNVSRLSGTTHRQMVSEEVANSHILLLLCTGFVTEL